MFFYFMFSWLLLCCFTITAITATMPTSIGDGNQRSCLSDIYFLIDSSSATGPARFHKLRHFVSDVATEFWRAGYYSTRLGAIRFGGSTGAEITLPLTSVDQRKSIVNGLARTFYTGGKATRLDKAFDVFSQQGMHFSRGNRDLVRDLLLVITDDPYDTNGVSDHHSKYSHDEVVKAASQLKQNGVGIMVMALANPQHHHHKLNNNVSASNVDSPGAPYLLLQARSAGTVHVAKNFYLPPPVPLYHQHQNDVPKFDAQQVQQDEAIAKNLFKQKTEKPHPFEAIASTPHFFWQLDNLDTQLKAFIDTAILQLCQLSDAEDAANSTYLPNFNTMQQIHSDVEPYVKKSLSQKSFMNANKKQQQENVFKQQESNNKKETETKPPKPKTSNQIILFIPPLFGGKFFSAYKAPQSSVPKSSGNIKVSINKNFLFAKNGTFEKVPVAMITKTSTTTSRTTTAESTTEDTTTTTTTTTETTTMVPTSTTLEPTTDEQEIMFFTTSVEEMETTTEQPLPQTTAEDLTTMTDLATTTLVATASQKNATFSLLAETTTVNLTSANETSVTFSASQTISATNETIAVIPNPILVDLDKNNDTTFPPFEAILNDPAAIRLSLSSVNSANSKPQSETLPLLLFLSGAEGGKRSGRH